MPNNVTEPSMGQQWALTCLMGLCLSQPHTGIFTSSFFCSSDFSSR